MKKLFILSFVFLISFKGFGQVFTPKKVSPIVVSPDAKKVLSTSSSLVPLAPKAGKYFLKTALADRYLDIKDGSFNAGSMLQIWDLHGGWGQVWEAIPSGDADYFYLKSETARYLDVKNASSAVGTAIQMWSFNGSNAQKWKFIPQVGGYSLQSKLGTFLEVNAPGTTNGNTLWMQEKQTNAALANAQKWILTPAGKGNELNGFVDMHTHPMSYLGFGSKLFHGAPDVGSLLPAGTKYSGFDLLNRECNPRELRATSINDALGCCAATHGGSGPDNDCGNDIRHMVIAGMEDAKKVQENHGNGCNGGGVNTRFEQWPKWNDMTHQQMWVDWIKRAHDGGLNLMVALAVNNKTLAEAVLGDAPVDDKNSADRQIIEIKAFVNRHNDFMEVAYNASDIKRIIYYGKMAVVIGIEIDNIGNFNTITNLTQGMITNEVNRLYDLGVRYAFPVHVVDNKFGGTAVYEGLFNYSNRKEAGNYFSIECTDASEGINFKYDPGQFKDRYQTDVLNAVINGITDGPPTPAYCATGHKNTKGLSTFGEFAIKEMMKKGILIDIDHMSQYSANRTLELSRENGGYPINSGHNGLRIGGGTENSRTMAQVQKIAESGGIFGVGWGGGKNNDTNGDSRSFLANYRSVLSAMGGKNTAIGTDINGLVSGPRPRPGASVYDYRGKIKNTELEKCSLAGKTWDYNTEGVAHYGLFPEFIQDLNDLAGKRETDALFKTADNFAQMWEKCERASVNIR